jgi:pimeloyl-ACP methyl ester carboxylesterase
MNPKTKYTKCGEINLAYQVIGEGPIDIIYIPGWVSNIDIIWEDPKIAVFLNRLTKFSRLILFDKRGTGLSDRVQQLSTLEERMDDILSVMDAANSQKAFLFGHSEGGTVSCLFSATYPHRVSGLITFGAFAKRQFSPDYPWAPKDNERELFYKSIKQGWGDSGEMGLDWIMPSMKHDLEYFEIFARYMRSAASPGAALALAQMNTEADITHLLHSIKVPTLILHKKGDKDANVEEARYMADKIPESKFVELEGVDHVFWTEDIYAVIAEIEEFTTGVRPYKVFDRVLSTILFTDIVGSTNHLSRVGDKKWMEILEKHNAIVRAELKKFNGKEIKSTGDGFLATFDGPSRAIRCADAIRNAVKLQGIEITAGIHTGEVEIYDEKDIGGIAVHVAARVLGKAGPDEILITMTVKHLLGGTGLHFKEFGEVELKGIEEKYKLFALQNIS